MRSWVGHGLLTIGRRPPAGVLRQSAARPRPTESGTARGEADSVNVCWQRRYLRGSFRQFATPLSLLCGGNHTHNSIVVARSPVSRVLPYEKIFAEFAWLRSKPYQSAPAAETPLDTIPGAPCIGRSWVSTARNYPGLRVALAARGKGGSAVRRVPARRKSDFCCESARRRLQKSDLGACAVPIGQKRAGPGGHWVRLNFRARPAFIPCRLFGTVTPEPVVQSIVRL